MKNNINKIVLKYSVITVIVLITITTMLYGVFAIFFPKPLAQFTYNLGWHKLSLSYFEKTYKKSNDEKDVYNALTVAITTNNSKKIVEIYKVLESMDGYDSLIDKINESTKNANLNIIDCLSLINEKNYLVNRYIRASIRLGDIDESKSIALSTIDIGNIVLDDIGVYPYLYLINEVLVPNDFTLNDFNVLVGNNRLIDAIKLHFEELVLLFDSNIQNISKLTNYEKSNLLFVSNRINQLYDAMVIYNSHSEFPIADQQQLKDKVEEINLMKIIILSKKL